MIVKFRAECAWDIAQLMTETKATWNRITITRLDPYPDVEVVIDSEMSIEDWRECLSVIPDSHVMVDTVQPIELYTGHR